MKTQFTPGPWDFSYVPGEYGHVITIASGEIAEAFAETVGIPQAVANARLIAAAPDLFAAGERCLQALAANGAPNCEAVKEMRAAIARVTQS